MNESTIIRKLLLFIIVFIAIITASNGSTYASYILKTAGNDYDRDANYIIQDRVDQQVEFDDDVYNQNTRQIPENNIAGTIATDMPQLSMPFYIMKNSYRKKTNRKLNHKKKVKESNIYYIRLPPTPYMMVPGLGYISQPPSIKPLLEAAPPPISLPQSSEPIDFNDGYVSDSDYASNNYNGFSNNYRRKPTVNKKKTKNSKIERIRGLFYFNGRPENIFLLPVNRSN